MGSLNRLHFHAFAAAFPGLQVLTPSRRRTFNVIYSIHFSELHEGQLLNSEQLGLGHLQMPSF